ncbi:hypothetical protein DFJ73DRAFT_764894 [Zopfochytrium polystomum]|nr:hypothetical protein DFJ73DRAFT_764894 [Zopfochytrium polystomum]
MTTTNATTTATTPCRHGGNSITTACNDTPLARSLQLFSTSSSQPPLVWLLALSPAPAAAGKKHPTDENGFPAAPVDTVGDGVYKSGKPNSRWNIFKNSAKNVAKGAASDGVGVANNLATNAVGTAVSAFAGRTARGAAKIGAGAALGAAEEAGQALARKDSFKSTVKFPLESVGQGLKDGKPLSARNPLSLQYHFLPRPHPNHFCKGALAAGADALTGNGDKTGWDQDPKLAYFLSLPQYPAKKPTPKQEVGRIATAAAEGIANKVVPLAAAGAATAAGGPIAGVAAGVGTAAAMGFAEGVGHGLKNHEPPKKVLEDGLGRMGEVTASTVPGRAALKDPISHAVAGTLNGAIDAAVGPPALGAAGKKLQRAAAGAGRVASAVGEMQGRVVAGRVDGGRAGAGAAAGLKAAQAAGAEAAGAHAAAGRESERAREGAGKAGKSVHGGARGTGGGAVAGPAAPALSKAKGKAPGATGTGGKGPAATTTTTTRANTPAKGKRASLAKTGNAGSAKTTAVEPGPHELDGKGKALAAKTSKTPSTVARSAVLKPTGAKKNAALAKAGKDAATATGTRALSPPSAKDRASAAKISKSPEAAARSATLTPRPLANAKEKAPLAKAGKAASASAVAKGTTLRPAAPHDEAKDKTPKTSGTTGKSPTLVKGATSKPVSNAAASRPGKTKK